MPIHDPFQVAERLAFLDQLTHGRLIARIGAIGMPADGKLYEVNPAESKPRMLEGIEIVDISQERLNKAKELGADYIIHPMNEDSVQKIVSITGNGVDIAFEAAGVSETFANAITTINPGGTVSMIAIYESMVPFDPNILFEKEGKIIFSCGYANEYQEVIELIAHQFIDAKQIITKEINLNNLVEDGLVFLVKDKSQSKIWVRPNSYPMTSFPFHSIHSKVNN